MILVKSSSILSRLFYAPLMLFWHSRHALYVKERGIAYVILGLDFLEGTFAEANVHSVKNIEPPLCWDGRTMSRL